MSRIRTSRRPQIFVYQRSDLSLQIQKILRICVCKRTGPQSAHFTDFHERLQLWRIVVQVCGLRLPRNLHIYHGKCADNLSCVATSQKAAKHIQRTALLITITCYFAWLEKCTLRAMKVKAWEWSVFYSDQNRKSYVKNDLQIKSKLLDVKWFKSKSPR